MERPMFIDSKFVATVAAEAVVTLVMVFAFLVATMILVATHHRYLPWIILACAVLIGWWGSVSILNEGR